MKILHPLLCLAAGCLVFEIPARASTAPVGYLTYALPATSATTTAYISTPLNAASVYSGTVAVAGPNTITDSNANWNNGEFSQPPCHVLITSGTQAGRTLAVIANTGTQLTVDVTDDSPQSTALNLPGFAIASGDSFEIVPNDTIESFFGSATLAGGPDIGTADSVALWNGRNGAFDFYYFNTNVGHWVKNGDATLADAGNLALPAYAAMAIVRQAGRSPARLVLGGNPPTVAPLLKLIGGDSIQYYGSSVPVDLALDQLGLGANWARGHTDITADVISIYNAAHTKWKSYFERRSGKWLKPGGTDDKGATVVTAGSGIAFRKHQSVSGASSFIQISLPYTP